MHVARPFQVLHSQRTKAELDGKLVQNLKPVVKRVGNRAVEIKKEQPGTSGAARQAWADASALAKNNHIPASWLLLKSCQKLMKV